MAQKNREDERSMNRYDDDWEDSEMGNAPPTPGADSKSCVGALGLHLALLPRAVPRCAEHQPPRLRMPVAATLINRVLIILTRGEYS